MSDIIKSTEQTVSASVPDAEAMAKISSFARRDMKPEEVYVFPVVLCDNDIDRDGERFTEACLNKLAGMMVGRTGIRDHEAKADNQAARLYDCFTETSATEKNALGDPLMRLIGSAYMLRTEGNRERIAAIEGGIAKEVSISCSVAEQRCSICGHDVRICDHFKGRVYGGKRCFAELDRPTDAYEWSFVAIPAQKGAGVIKMGKAVKKMKENEALVKSMATGTLVSCEETLTLSPEEAVGLSERVASLQKLAEVGRKHEEETKNELLRLLKLCEVDLSEETAKSIGEKLSADEKDEIVKWLNGAYAKKFPVMPQTAPEQAMPQKESFDSYRI